MSGSIIGKTFKSIKTNELITVSNIDGTVAILDNDERIAVGRLLDNNYYITTSINENKNTDMGENRINEDALSAFGNNSNLYSSLANQLSSVVENTDPRAIQETNKHLQGAQYTESGSAIKIVESIEDRNSVVSNNTTIDKTQEQELLEKARRQQEMLNKNIAKQANSIKKKLNIEEDDEDFQVSNIDDEREVGIKMIDDVDATHIRNTNKEIEKRAQKQLIKQTTNPMFLKMKRVKKVKLNIEFEEMLPTKELLKMLEDGFEDSVIEYLTKEITEKIFSDLDVKDQIKKKIHEYVYGKTPVKKRTPVKRTSTTSTTSKK